MHQYPKKMDTVLLGYDWEKDKQYKLFLCHRVFPQEASPSFMRFWICGLGQVWDLIDSRPLDHMGSKDEHVWSAVDCVEHLLVLLCPVIRVNEN